MKKIAKEIKQLNILTDSQLNTILDTANNNWELLIIILGLDGQIISFNLFANFRYLQLSL